MAADSKRARKLDRRVIRTRKAIMNAFDKLVSTCDIDKITVSAIAREADIDRKTFYLHYQSINDLSNRKTEETLERVLGTLNTEGANKTPPERIHIVLTETNRILMENITLYANIATQLSTDRALGYFEQAAKPALAHAGINPMVADDQQIRMRLQFYIAGAISLYSTWLKSDRTEPIETVSNAIEGAILSSYMNELTPGK